MMDDEVWDTEDPLGGIESSDIESGMQMPLRMKNRARLAHGSAPGVPALNLWLIPSRRSHAQIIREACRRLHHLLFFIFLKARRSRRVLGNLSR